MLLRTDDIMFVGHSHGGISGALVMGLVSFGLFVWALDQGWSEDSARNAVLLLMVGALLISRGLRIVLA